MFAGYEPKFTRNDFNFPLVKFPFICSNMQTAPVCIYLRASGYNHDVLDNCLLLTERLLNQGFYTVPTSSVDLFYGRHLSPSF
jgi:hypothetical protein